MGRIDLSGEAQFRRFWEICFSATLHNFANKPHFVALTQLWATKHGQKKIVPSSTLQSQPIREGVFGIFITVR